MSEDADPARYRALLGLVPDTVPQRRRVAARAGESDAVDAVEALRERLIAGNPLPPSTAQLVHFALLVGGGHSLPAELHARAALRAGASARDLFGVCELAAVTGGMPAFTLAVACVEAALAAPDLNPPPGS